MSQFEKDLWRKWICTPNAKANGLILDIQSELRNSPAGEISEVATKPIPKRNSQYLGTYHTQRALVLVYGGIFKYYLSQSSSHSVWGRARKIWNGKMEKE